MQAAQAKDLEFHCQNIPPTPAYRTQRDARTTWLALPLLQADS